MARERKQEAVDAGSRLRQTRVALGVGTARRFAQLTDEREENLQKWEVGAAMVPSRYVSKLKALYGVTHDWVFDGDMRHLPHELALKLMGGPQA